MEDHLCAAEFGQRWSDQFVQKLHESRRRAEGLLQAERERIRCAASALDRQLDALAAELARDREEATSRDSELERRAAALDEKSAELARLQQQLDDRQAQQDQLQIETAQHQQALLADFRKRHEQLQQRSERLDNSQREHEERRAEWERMRAEDDRHRAQWKEQHDAEEQGRTNSSRHPDESAEFKDLQRRFELAVQDVRELKTNKAELFEELVALRKSNDTSTAAAAPDALNWESQKRRILEQLDSDFDSNEPKKAKDRLTIEGAIRITDQVVAEKEQEIRDLKKLLADQSSSLGNAAAGAAAAPQVLDQDELIRQERANLQRLQEQWREKLRQAEIDISLERAKLARERVEMEERTHCRELELAKSSRIENPKEGLAQEKNPTRRRWRARLGLSDDPDEG